MAECHGNRLLERTCLIRSPRACSLYNPIPICHPHFRRFNKVLINTPQTRVVERSSTLPETKAILEIYEIVRYKYNNSCKKSVHLDIRKYKNPGKIKQNNAHNREKRVLLPHKRILMARYFPSLLGLSTAYKNSSLRQAGFAPQSGSGLDFASNSYQYLTRPIIEILRILHADFSIYSFYSLIY